MGQPRWEVDPFDDSQIWRMVVGKDDEDTLQSQHQAIKIFEGMGHGLRCLEVGAGVGRLLKHAREHFYYGFGVDASIALVAASTRYLQWHPTVTVILTDGVKLPFEDGYFDFVYSFTCFQHMPTLRTIRDNLKEIFRVLEPGGSCRIQTVRGENGTGRHDGYVFRTVQDFTLEFASVGFNEVHCTLEGEWLWATAKKPTGN